MNSEERVFAHQPVETTICFFPTDQNGDALINSEIGNITFYNVIVQASVIAVQCILDELGILFTPDDSEHDIIEVNINTTKTSMKSTLIYQGVINAIKSRKLEYTIEEDY